MIHTFNQSWSRPGSNLPASVDITITQETSLDVSLAASGTLTQDTVIDVSQVKCLYILSTVNCTIKTNSSGSPADVFTLVAGEPLAWHYLLPTGGGFAVNPFTSTTDVTKLFFTNTDSVNAGTITFRCGLIPATA